MKPKVVWTTREWRQIADWFARNGVNPDDRGFTTNLDAAQKATLPADRHRTMAGLPKEVRARVKEEVAKIQLKPGPVVHAPEPKAPSAQSLSTEELLVELARRIARFLEPGPTTLPVDRGFYPPPKHDPSPQREGRTVKPKFLIVGPRGQQQERLRTMFPLLDLRFVTCEENPALVRDRGMHCREIILWTKFMNHAQQESAKTLEGTVSTWYANGLEEIEARLRALHG